MKNIVIIFIFLVGCTVDKETNHLKINGKKFVLNNAIIEYTFTTDSLKTYRAYNLKFQSHNTGTPDHYLIFKIFSNNPDFLDGGIYNYTPVANKAGDFSECQAAFHLLYDGYNVPIHGLILKHDLVTRGTVVVTSKRSDLKFEFDITFTDNDTVYYLTGEYEGFLFEGTTGLDNN